MTTPATPAAPALPKLPRLLFQSPIARLCLIGILLVLLMIPANLIGQVVQERAARRAEAVEDVTGKWGLAQTINGPLLRLPYFVRTQTTDEKGVATQHVDTRYAFFLPRKLVGDARMTVEKRSRGIFEVPVYQLQLHLSGHFAAPALAELGINLADVDFAHAELLLGIADPRALHADASLRFENKPVAFKPAGDAITGVRATVGAQLPAFEGWQAASFDIQFAINGSEALAFAPLAEETRVHLTGDWPHPSFDGAWLPAERSVGDTGFNATWSVSYLGRNLAQQWHSGSPQFQGKEVQHFGVSLSTPVDTYAMAERITKYALLTLVFTFLVIWLMEMLTRVRLHAIQYGFIGAALSLFALLQLSVAEHFGFAAAFAASAVAVVGLVGFYSWSALRSGPRAVVVVGVLGGVYGYLYLILQAEDYALLGGSLALFVGLASAMWLTRKIDWGQAGLPEVGPAPQA